MIPRIRLLGAYCGRHLLMTEFWVFTVNQPVTWLELWFGIRDVIFASIEQNMRAALLVRRPLSSPLCFSLPEMVRVRFIRLLACLGALSCHTRAGGGHCGCIGHLPTQLSARYAQRPYAVRSCYISGENMHPPPNTCFVREKRNERLS